jgi:Carbohydrate-selective porin, OprB family
MPRYQSPFSTQIVPLALSLSLVFSANLGAWAMTGIDELNTAAQEAVTAQPAGDQAVAAAKTGKETLGKPGQPSQAQRAEMIAALSSVVASLEKDIQAMQLDKANDKDVKVLRESQKRLVNELAGLTKQVGLLETKDSEQDSRISLLERVQVHGDMSIGAMADIGSGYTGNNRGIQDSLTSLGRLRLAIEAPVVEPKNPESKVGRGYVHARLIAAFGRYGPQAASNDPATGPYYPFNAYSRVGADISAFNEGFGTGAVGANGAKGLNGQSGNTSFTRPNVFLESLFYKQAFKGGIPLLTALPGTHDDGQHRREGFETTSELTAGLVRWWDIFDVSPYRGDEQTQFQNNAFINIPGIAVNYAQPMVAYKWKQGLGTSANLELSSGVGSVDTGDFYDGMNITYEAKLNYKPGFLPEQFQKPGSVYIGGYNIFMAGNRNFNQSIQTTYNYTARNGSTNLNALDNNSASGSVYAGWNQEWWRGIGTSVGFLYNETSPSVAYFTTQQPGPANVLAGSKASFTSSVSIPMSVFGTKFRPQDTIGLGYAGVFGIQDGTNSTVGLGRIGAEHVAEAYYRMKVTDNFSIIPSFQLINNALGIKDNGNISAIGCRMSYSF